MSDDLVKRYSLDQFARFDGELHHADMEPCENGDWVSYADCAKLIGRIEGLEAEVVRLRSHLQWIHDGAHTRGHTLPDIKERAGIALDEGEDRG